MTFPLRHSLSLFNVTRPSIYRFYTTESSVNLLGRLKEDRKTYMRSKQQPDLNVVKGILSDYTYYIKSPNAPTDHSEDAMVLSVLQKSIKKRQDSIAQYTSGGRPELAANEEQELKVLQRYLPEQMSAEVIEEKVRALVEQLGASSMKDMGKVMKAWTVDPATADRKMVSDAVKKVLS
ncbi:Yqey-like protein-domain-containing protein [Halteromyces radiatus]|uniref:Yqey-like protein-domain-containing protein n=1 Tax=Halteromyces radiatus TaxID=101107 RepID=UPI00221FCA1F|nr:Yqey-like protein-domain-containing protein [Halteromyces radiatus]KAI8093219.1 Yqey-like protein-domain-containing protein [Halteromyces radiatus]